MRELNDYEKLILNACEQSNIGLTEQILDQLEGYYNLLVEWNEKINLTAITQKNDVYLKHFADSIYGAKLLKKGATLCDIGTGAGFPALVLKIVRSDLKVTLVDALEKRIKFLNEVINKLGLSDVTTLHFRAEDKLFKDKYLNYFDVVMARAVARMATLTEYCLPFVKIGGKFIAYKSDKIEDELKESNKAIPMLGGKMIKTHIYDLDTDTKRWLVEIEKVKNTDKKYPRDKNKPKNNPIL